MTAPNWHTHVRGLRIDQALDLLLPLGTIKCVRIAQRDGVPVAHSTAAGPDTLLVAVQAGVISSVLSAD
jgi:hypothetical protein